MLKSAPYVVIPVFKCKELNGKYVSKLNPFSTIWCVIENIFLAATAEGLGCSMRIPLNEEHDIVKAKLKVPPTYMIPVFIGTSVLLTALRKRTVMDIACGLAACAPCLILGVYYIYLIH